MTSSCTSANVCTSSSAAAASITAGSSRSPPAPTNAQTQNAGRSRLPPAATNSRSASIGSPSAASTASQRVCSVGEQRVDARLDPIGDRIERFGEGRGARRRWRSLAERLRRGPEPVGIDSSA